MTPAIRIDRLSKRYQFGALEGGARSFRDMLASAATAPLRRLRHLRGRAGDAQSFWALRNVSFDVPPGEVMAVVGRNGAGKSTLLKVLSRITDPTEGRVELRGRVASLLEVGTGFHPDLTGRENIALNGAILGMTRAEIKNKFDAIVEFAEVARFLDTPIKHYSSGMYLRLAFSVAAHLDGEILLVDEVLAVGDVAFQQKCLGKMRDVSRRGRTVVFISHNMAAIATLCSRAVVLDRGEPVFDGRAQDAIRYYLEHHLNADGSSWDLADSARRAEGLGSFARLVRVAARTTRHDGFAFGEALRFTVTFRSETAADQISCAIGLDDLYGARIVTFRSDGEAMSTVRGVDYEIDVTVPPFGLLPGKYLLSVSLYSGGQYHDYLIHFGAITVQAVDLATGDHVPDQADGGAIAVPTVWRIHAVKRAS